MSVRCGDLSVRSECEGSCESEMICVRCGDL